MLVTNARIVTFGASNTLIEPGSLHIRDGLFHDFGPSFKIDALYEDAHIFDAKNMLLLPGLVIPHTHLYGAFARGMALKDTPPKNFLENLQRLWWRLDKALTPEDIRYSAYAVLIECIKSGTTTVIDHHASPGAVPGSLDIIAEVVEEFGLRAVLCYEVSDRDGKKIAGEGINENVRFVERCRKQASGYLGALFGIHASFTVSDETLCQCREAADTLDVGFHFHLAEGKTDRRETKKEYGYDSPVRRMAKLGILRKNTIVAHAIDVTPEEMEILKEMDVVVVHNPQSNMNNAVGMADLPTMTEMGITLGLGTDGYTTSLLREAEVASILPKHHFENPQAGGNIVESMVTSTNGLIASRYLLHEVGSIRKGNFADFMLVDYHPPTPMTSQNIWGHLMFGVARQPVDTVVVGGKILMRGQKLLVCDEEVLMHKAREQAAALWRRM